MGAQKWGPGFVACDHMIGEYIECSLPVGHEGFHSDGDEQWGDETRQRPIVQVKRLPLLGAASRAVIYETPDGRHHTPHRRLWRWDHSADSETN